MKTIKVLFFLALFCPLIPSWVQAQECFFLGIIMVERRPTAEELMTRLKLGEDFSELARTRSIGPAADDGGYLGRVCFEQLKPSFQKVLSGMMEGQISDILNIEDRYVIIKRISRKKASEKEAFQKGIKEEQGDADYYLKLGISLGEKGFIEKEIWAYQEALILDPQSAEAHLLLGEALRRNGRYEEAIKELKRAIELQPDMAEAHNNLGLAYINKAMLLLALHEFKRAIEIKPSFGEAHNNLAASYLLMKRYDLASDHARRAKELNYPVDELLKEIEKLSDPERH